MKSKIGEARNMGNSEIYNTHSVEPITDAVALAKMSSYLKQQSDRDYMMFIVGINLGLRVSDYLPLTVGFIRNALNLGYVELEPKKTKNTKKSTSNKVKLPMPKDLGDKLSAYIKGKEDTEYLFPSREGSGEKYITRQRCYQILNDAASDIGLNVHIGCHTMRKTFGYWQYKQHKDVRFLMEIFNHSSEKITLNYIGVSYEDKENSMYGFSIGIDA